ncbi:MAG: O-methyltransferase [Bdellovibrionota bacterium]
MDHPGLPKPTNQTSDGDGRTKPVADVIEKYLSDLYRIARTRKMSAIENQVLEEMEAHAREGDFPIVGPLVGPFLEFEAGQITAKRVFEFGSGFGYSAFWFARAVGSAGKVICVEGDEENVARGREWVSRLGFQDRVEFHCAMAQDVFSREVGTFDVVYNDADKDQYPGIWELAKGRIRPGGLYICDNTLWSGRVAAKPGTFVDVMPGWTEAIVAHNRAVALDSDFQFYLNPIRDGVLIAKRAQKSLT